MNRFQIKSDNRAVFSNPTVVLSTVEMPRSLSGILDYRYESCLFGAGDSNVVARYNTLSEAVAGHTKLTAEYGLKAR